MSVIDRHDAARAGVRYRCPLASRGAARIVGAVAGRTDGTAVPLPLGPTGPEDWRWSTASTSSRHRAVVAMPEARPGASSTTSHGSNPARKERKLATVLFADLVGSTALAEREDPEVVQALLARLFERIEREVERHGGLIEKFIGDAALAVFGLPIAHEDDAERAVRAALAVQAAVADLDRALAAEGRPRVALRIGVEAGEVLVDIDRVAGPRHRMLTGDTVNTAARPEQAASPGQVVGGPAVQ